MKKKTVVMCVICCLLVLAFSFVLTGQFGKAESNKEVYQMDGTTLMKYMGTSEVVYVPDSVRVIASGAFEDNDYIKKVVLPYNLTTIEYNAFTECDNLLEIDIPDNVIKIGSAAFANCKSLCDVSIGKSVAEVGSGVFAGCSALADIDVSEKSTTLTCLDGVLMSADRTYIYQMLPGREKPFYIMNERVKQIGQYAFWGCENLEHVILSDKIEIISPYAFSNASNLKSVSMSFAVTDISMKAFEDCVNLEQIFIPDSIIRIHSTAFDGCDKVQFYTANGSYGKMYADEQSIATIMTPVYSLSYAEQLKDEYYAALKAEEESARQEAIAPKPIEIGPDVIGYTTIVGNQAVILMDSGKAQVLAGSNAECNDKLQDMALVGAVPENSFYGDDNIEEVDIPEEITEIGRFAFARSSITSVIIPEGTTSIEYAAFYHCDNLENVIIPSSVTYIGNNAFAYTPWLENWYANGEEDYLIVGDGILLGYKGEMENFKMPSGVKMVACDIPQ